MSAAEAKADVDGFLERFFAFGSKPSVETYLPLFHADATLFDSGMERPLTFAEIPESIAATLQLIPEFEMVPERWRTRGPTLFVEARNSASLGDSKLQWRSVYCVDLVGDRVIRGRRYYDRRPLFALVDPSLPALPPLVVSAQDDPPPIAEPEADHASIVRAIEDCWTRGKPEELQLLYREDGCLVGPGFARPLARSEMPAYHDAWSKLIPDLEMDLLTWAGDDEVLFLEWQARGTIGEARVIFGIAERFDLAAGLILHGRTYFDTLALAGAMASA